MALSKWFNHRYKFAAKVYNLLKKDFERVTVFLDTGCYNTMIPRDLAEQSGHSLGFKVKYSLGASLVETEAFSIEKIMIGDFVLERVVAFAGNYKGGHEDDIILGTNVINNWEMIISKKKHSFQFREDPPDSLPNRTNIYQNYFNKEGKYIYVQDS
ncbi:MAG: retropepsin-like domain-containing protein [Treponema sp.]|nr:retropepsin-like domain-containing protein [Treponema sp.]